MARNNGTPASRAADAITVSNTVTEEKRVAEAVGDVHDLLEASPFEIDGGQVIGRDPRTVPAHVWQAVGISRLTPMQAIRMMCMSCNFTAAEVRKCVCTSCKLWPYRFGSVPKGLRDAETEDGTKFAPSSSKRSAEGL